MFSGIVQKTSPVVSATEHTSIRTLRIQKPRGWKLGIGQSVAVDGICSTVTKHGTTFFEVEYMPETLSKTTAASFTKGILVNLERSLTLKDFVDGHLVQGHVDAYVPVVVTAKEGDSRMLTVQIPTTLRKYIALQGSIAINGVSLTVARLKGNLASVALIPHTLKYTNLGRVKRGDTVNVEVDILARYLVAAFRQNGRVKPNATKRIRKKG